MTSGAQCTLFAVPTLTTFRSTSSTGFPARAPPISRATWSRRSPSNRSTCPATSSRPSRGRASHIPSGMSFPARARRWRATSGRTPPREMEPLGDDVKRRERVMLGLRLDEPLWLAGLEEAVDGAALERMEALGLAVRLGREQLRLTSRGRFLGGGVTAELLA